MIQDALKDLTKRQLEELREKIDKELQTCAVCGNEGALYYLITRKGIRASIYLDKPCFEKYRLPESRAKNE